MRTDAVAVENEMRIGARGVPAMTHVPVMTSEVMHYLLRDDTRTVLDATVGCGGHARRLVEACPHLTLIGIDRDPQALVVAEGALGEFASRCHVVQGNYGDVARLLEPFGKVDGALVDLGVSSLQIDTAGRGFSHSTTGPLDMRMGHDGPTARQFVVESSAEQVADVLREYGEVRGARRLAARIKNAASQGRMDTTSDLVAAVRATFGTDVQPQLVSKVFQAFRIAVNDELGALRRFLADFGSCARPRARLVVLSYHSLEDRIIKDFFAREAKDCVCPPQVPECRCGHRATLKVLTRRVVKPSRDEIAANPRARSAKLRAAEFIGGE